MKRQFADFLHQAMLMDYRIWLVTADLGYKLWDSIAKDFPDRFINVGASEQAGMGICVGLAKEGKIPVFYSISTFAIYRPFETIRNYLHYEQIPVKILGGGRGRDYHIDGYSHWPLEQKEVLDTLNIQTFYPKEIDGKYSCFRQFLYNNKPSYLNLKK